ncbi:response regulator [Candidatus Poribacteria bacterium]|nr:response regulator [Candidatus Poribacteria bacterium]
MINKTKSKILNMSLYHKIMVPFSIILLFSLLIVSIFLINDMSIHFNENKKDKADSLIKTIQSYSYLIETFDYQNLQSNIDIIKKSNKDLMYLYVLDNENKYIAGTSPEFEGKKISIPENLEALHIEGKLKSETADLGSFYFALNLKEINNEILYTIIIIISIALIFLIVSILIYRFIIKKAIIKPLTIFSLTADSVSMGDFPKIEKIQTDDEVGRLSVSLIKMVDFLLYIKDQANEIAKGNYNVDISPRSENDILGKALYSMKNSLIKTKEKADNQDWIKSGLTGLNDLIRGEQDISTLAQNIIKFLCNYLNAQIGTLYVTDGNNILHMVGSYAYTKRKEVSNEFKLGEGLIGQCALEKQAILITNVPPDYIKIQSGLGEKNPNNIIVVPFIYENEVKGVIELGSFYEFTDLKIEYLKQITESIAISLNTTESRIKTNNLLKETQNQAQELRQQQEELRQVNETLEIQTEALKKSEARLQEQQEELKQTNEELEEQAKLLEKQKDYINIENIELEKAQKVLEQKAEELKNSSRYKSQFLANMSHELRTPLNSMLLLSSLLVKNKENNLTDKQKEYAKSINHAGTDLLNLINDILDLSKIEAGRMELNIETVNLDNFISNISRSFKQIIQEKGLGFNITKSNDLPLNINTDRQRIEQVIKNLISNAIKFTSKGEIKLELYIPDKSEGLIKEGLNSIDCIAIKVSDTGIGIPEDKQKDLFHAFKQVDGSTSRKYGGTGLGLAISKDFVHLLGGEITLKSEVNKGSIFTIYLPMLAKNRGKIEVKVNLEEVKTAEKPDEKNEEIHTGEDDKKIAREFNLTDIRDDRKNISFDDKTILIIEDDPNFAKILFEFAQEKGFKGLIADDGESGLVLADQYNPKAIILDIKLPRMDGWTVMERIRNNPKTSHIPIHFISASDKKNEALQKGAIGFLIKPVSIENLEIVFSKIENIISKDIKNILIIEKSKEFKENISNMLLNRPNIVIRTLDKSDNAIDEMKTGNFDCLIIGFENEDVSGFELIEIIRKDKSLQDIPIIVYASRELTEDEDNKLRKYTESIIIKGSKSLERLLDEINLFLHKVDDGSSEKRKKVIKMLENEETVLKGKKGLLVDDDMRNVFALSSILEERGMIIIIARNGKEALDCIEKNQDIDIVLMDIMMPIMDGYQATEEIRKQHQFKNLPIIALTAKAMAGDRKKCIDSGASDYLSKPIDMDKLLSLLKVWLYK